ncbi:MAG: ATP phosphoribosyltransferase regulatory subunit [Zymomonas mobilis]|uniref:ATP phosphoribosyltransferase regulatory subunit n=1 Tax=Zymomonas mobilis TaxID=542 RepID=UPI0039E89E55
MTIAHGLLPEGLRDRLPPQAEAASRLLHHVIVAINRHGYERVSPPLAEFEESLLGRLKSARKQDLLRFVDPVSQRSLALRPDITGQIGRIATTRLNHRPRPLRLAYGGTVMKLRATQLRPERELMQAGAELIGNDSVAAVIEILGMAVETLKIAGVKEISIDLTLPDLVERLADTTLPIDASKREKLFAVLDAKDAGGLSELDATGYRPLLEAAGPFDEAIEKLQPMAEKLGFADRLEALKTIRAALDPSVHVTLDPTERHGFEYQTWIGFSLFGSGILGEIGRGGSYTIIHQDKREEQAVGFSLYIDPLVDAGLGQKKSRKLFLPLGHDPEQARAFRQEGWITIAALDEEDDPVRHQCTDILTGGHIKPL